MEGLRENMKFWRMANVYWCVLFISLGIFVSQWEFDVTATRSESASRMLAYAVLGIGALLILFIQLAWRYYLAGKEINKKVEPKRKAGQGNLV